MKVYNIVYNVLEIVSFVYLLYIIYILSTQLVLTTGMTLILIFRSFIIIKPKN